MLSHRTLSFGFAIALMTLSLQVSPLSSQPLAVQDGDQSSGALIVAVRGPANRPVPGAQIEINGQGTPFKVEGVAKDGTYRGPALAPGRYRITVSAPCYQKFVSDFEVASGHPANPIITLTPAGGASGCKAADFEFADSGGLKAGEINGAVDAAGYSSQAETESTELRQALAEVIAEPGSHGKAENQAESRILARGNDLLLRGDYRQAADVFREGAAQYPLAGHMLVALGVSYFAAGNYDEAVEAFCKAADLNPDDRRPYFFLARANGSSAGAMALVLDRLELNAKNHPADAAAQYEYALALWRAHLQGQGTVDNSRVEQLLRSALALDDSLAEAHFELGVVLSPTRPEQAMTELERAAFLQPDWAEAHYRLGQLYERAGEKDRARRELAEYERLHKRGSRAEAERLREEMRRLLPGDAGG